MVPLLVFLLTLLPQANGSADVPAELTEAVTAYWQALEKHDKVSAMQYVYPEDLNNFLNRQDADFRNWHCVSTQLVDSDTAKVVVSFERFVLKAYLESDAREVWVRTDQGWKVRVERPISITDRIHRAVEKSAKSELPARLDVVPARLTFYGLAPRQPSALRIRNGLDLPAEIVNLEYDPSMLTAEGSVTTIAPHSSARIFFRYSGRKLTEENVEGKIVLKIRQGGEERTIEVPVVYNYMNDLERWISRQTKTSSAPPPKQR
ncbi:MAG: hypothetical protein WAO20_01590 [Acidobacteriota bacterium]